MNGRAAQGAQDGRAQQAGKLPVARFEGMSVNPQRNRGISVAQSSSDRADICASADGSGGREMPQLVEVRRQPQRPPNVPALAVPIC